MCVYLFIQSFIFTSKQPETLDKFAALHLGGFLQHSHMVMDYVP